MVEPFVLKETDTIVVEVETSKAHVIVVRDTQNLYHVARDAVLRHPGCDAEAAIRALGFYLQGALYQQEKTPTS